MNFFNVGDTASFQIKVKEQLVNDLREAQEEYNDAILEEDEAKTSHKRRAFLKENPKAVKTAADRKLCGFETSWYKTNLDAAKAKRKTAKKEVDEAQKALDSHKEDEAKGFQRESDIQKVGNQYKTAWTFLPS